MQVESKKIKEGVVELTVSLERGDLDKYLAQTEKGLAQNLTIPGFRPGKAPKEEIRKYIGAQTLLEEALQNAVQESMAQATRDQKLDVIDSENFKIHENTADKLRYTVMLKVLPYIEALNIDKIQIKRNLMAVSEVDVTQALETIRQMKSTFVDKAESAALGDRVEVDFKTDLDGKPVPQGESKNHPLIIGGKNFMPGFEEELVGLNAGQTKNFSLTAPKDYYQKDLAGKKLDFAVKLVRVQRVVRPELNDAFAQSVGKFQTLAQLMQSVTEGLTLEKEQKEHQRVQLEILDAIIAKEKVPVPEFLVQQELDDMIARFDGDLHVKGMELSVYLNQLGKTQEEFRNGWLKEAERQAKIFSILRVVARDQKIVIAPAELEAVVNQNIQALISRQQIDPSQIDMQKVRTSIANGLLTEKTLQFLEKICSA